MGFGEHEINLSTEELGVETAYRNSLSGEEENPPAEFTPEQKQLIDHRLNTLSTLAQFIGKDFTMPVELNKPGAGWYWDANNNIVRVDPKDLLEKPMDYLRFVISHEGGHRRITRADFIPLEEWRQLGFSLMMNAIEDPRDNNFVKDSYPRFREEMELVYQERFGLEHKAKTTVKEKTGFQPRFVQAAFEYIRQWFREIRQQEFAIDDQLPSEVREVIEKTFVSAQDSWWRYPTRQEADTSEELIRQYAQDSYEINRDEIWPEFKKLIDADLKDEQMQQALQDMQRPGQPSEGSGQGIPQELKEHLTPEQRRELEQAISDAIDQAQKQPDQPTQTGDQEGLPEGLVDPVKTSTKLSASDKQTDEPIDQPQVGQSEIGKLESGESGASSKPKPINLESLSEGLKQKIREYIESLPPERQRELATKAEAVLREVQAEINEQLGGKMSDDPEKKAEREAYQEQESPRAEPPESSRPAGGEALRTGETMEPQDVDLARLAYRERIHRELREDANLYEKTRREMLTFIDQLEADLRAVFVARKTKSWQSGLRIGKRIDIKRRIQEKAKGISAMESKAWQKREIPDVRDYAISLLVDLSGSMQRDRRIEETFKAIVVLAEVLNRLSINLEILGFNDEIFEYQSYGEPMSDQIRGLMGGMFQEVEDSCCKKCGNEHNETDLGWATKIAAERLASQREAEKFLITISDGVLTESTKHPSHQYPLNQMIKQVQDKTNIRLVGLGVGNGTEKMTSHYPNSIANVEVREMVEKLADLILNVIEEYDYY